MSGLVYLDAAQEGKCRCQLRLQSSSAIVTRFRERGTNKWRGYERHQKTRPAAVSENRYPVPVLIDENSRFANAKRRVRAEIDFLLNPYAAYLFPRISDPHFGERFEFISASRKLRAVTYCIFLVIDIKYLTAV